MRYVAKVVPKIEGTSLLRAIKLMICVTFVAVSVIVILPKQSTASPTGSDIVASEMITHDYYGRALTPVLHMVVLVPSNCMPFDGPYTARHME